MLRRHLDLLGYPAEDHEGRVRTVSDLLKKQAEELTQVSEYATQHMSKLVEAMETQTIGLGQASDKAAAEVHLIRDRLMVDVETLQDLVKKIEADPQE